MKKFIDIVTSFLTKPETFLVIPFLIILASVLRHSSDQARHDEMKYKLDSIYYENAKLENQQLREIMIEQDSLESITIENE